MGWKQEAKEIQRKLYGNYCNKMKKQNKEPLPFHKWQEQSMKN